MPLLEKGQPQNSSLNFNKIAYKDWIHLPQSRALRSGDTIWQSTYPLLYGRDKVRGIKMLTIKGPEIELFWGTLSHLTLQLKNKCSKLKHPDPFGNEQLREKFYHLSPSERCRQGHAGRDIVFIKASSSIANWEMAWEVQGRKGGNIKPRLLQFLFPNIFMITIHTSWMVLEDW